MYSESPVWS